MPSQPGKGKQRIFRDPVHGLIAFRGDDAALDGVLATRAVQRLRRVGQMGFASWVYPGAEHSRFGHALGAFHVADRVAQALALPARVARDVKAAALLHDIGHGPFSHAWEEALGGPSHEQWGARILAEDAELRGALAAAAPELPAAVEALFAGRYTPAFATKLVSSQLDVDRMDYLLRDAHYTGVGYSAYDLGWLIYALSIAPVRGGADPDDLVIDYRRGVHAVEQFLSGRFYMYAQVYYHKTVRAAESMFLLAMRRFAELAREGREPPGLASAAKLARGEHLSVADYLWLDDARVQCAIDDWCAHPDPVLADLCRRLSARRLFKAIELGDDLTAADQVIPRLEAAARARFGDRAGYYFAIDRAERLGYAVRPEEELFVVGHPREAPFPLGRLVEKTLGRQVFTIRAICAPELTDDFRAICAAG
jgi:uncharacterized protein